MRLTRRHNNHSEFIILHEPIHTAWVSYTAFQRWYNVNKCGGGKGSTVKDKMLAVNVSATHDMFAFVRLTGCAPYFYLYKMCHITFTLDVFDLTLTWDGGEGDDVGVAGEKSTKSATAVSRSRLGWKKAAKSSPTKTIKMTWMALQKGRNLKPFHVPQQGRDVSFPPWLQWVTRSPQYSDFSSRPRADFFDCNFRGVGFEVPATVFYVQRKGVNINTACLSLLAGPIFYSRPPSSCEPFGL